MGEAILHIGTTKTGTTSLQKLFLWNQELLATHGVAFPTFKTRRDVFKERNGIFLNQHCLRLAGGNAPYLAGSDLEENVNKLSASLAAHGRVLMSDEDIFLLSSRLLDDARASELYWRTMARFLEDAGAHDVTIVVYLRRQDQWAASQWRQEIKTGHKDETFAAFCNSRDARLSMDYAGMIAAASQAFGEAARIVVRRYDRAFFEGGDIYHDFCAASGIPWDDAYRIPEVERNVSLSFDVAEALRAFMNDAPPNTSARKNLLIPLARELSKERPDAPRLTPIDEEATRELMEPYLEGNESIAKRFLGGDPLFSCDYGGRPVWTPDEERIAECRAAFKKALRSYYRWENVRGVMKPVTAMLPEVVKRPLRDAKKRLAGA